MNPTFYFLLARDGKRPQLCPAALRGGRGRDGRITLGRLAGCIFLASVSAFAQQPVSYTPPASAALANTDALLIGPGDMLDLTVYNVPDLTLRTRVDTNGTVLLPLIGNMHLAGETAHEAEQAIAQALVAKQMVKDPEVSLLISDFATQGISVTGEVNMPGIYPLIGPHRLYDAISAAGGLTVKAGTTISIIHKDNPGQPETIQLSSTASVAEANVTVRPGDTVVVAKAGVVYVVGEVNHPGAFLMEDNTSISILKAIALAQGTTKLASFKHACILRKGPSGMEQIPIPLNRIYHHEGQDSLLHPEDVVFIPTSSPKMYGQMGVQAALSATGTAAIYATK
jgi:polysaccharide export outer membrane protein